MAWPGKSSNFDRIYLMLVMLITADLQKAIIVNKDLKVTSNVKNHRLDPARKLITLLLTL